MKGCEAMAKYAIELLKEKPRYIFEGSERDFEKHIIENIDLICESIGLPDIYAIRQQKQIRFEKSLIVMDILIRHIDGSATIFEVKKTNDKNPHTSTREQVSSIGQMLLYKNVFKAKTGVEPRVALLTDKLLYRTMVVFNETELPLTLIEFQRNRLFVPYMNW